MKRKMATMRSTDRWMMIVTRITGMSTTTLTTWRTSCLFWNIHTTISTSMVTTMGAISHVSTHECFHASVHMAASLLDHVSLLSPPLEQPLRHSETSCSHHLPHQVDHISLIVRNPLWYARWWLSDIGMIDGILPILTSTSMDWPGQS